MLLESIPIILDLRPPYEDRLIFILIFKGCACSRHLIGFGFLVVRGILIGSLGFIYGLDREMPIFDRAIRVFFSVRFLDC